MDRACLLGPKCVRARKCPACRFPYSALTCLGPFSYTLPHLRLRHAALCCICTCAVLRACAHQGLVSIELFTLAVTVLPPAEFPAAMDLYTEIQKRRMRPDGRFFAALISLAGRAGELETAFGLLEEMSSEGVAAGSEAMGSLMRACLMQRDLPLARRVYDACRSRGIFPDAPIFNWLMEQYAVQGRCVPGAAGVGGWGCWGLRGVSV